jgi:hypothetical protein
MRAALPRSCWSQRSCSSARTTEPSGPPSAYGGGPYSPRVEGAVRAVRRHGHVDCGAHLPHPPTPIAACGLQLPLAGRGAEPAQPARNVRRARRRHGSARASCEWGSSGSSGSRRSGPLSRRKPGRQAAKRQAAERPAQLGDGREDRMTSEIVGDRMPAPLTVRSHRARRRVRRYWSAAVVFPFTSLRVRLRAARSGIPTDLRPAARR